MNNELFKCLYEERSIFRDFNSYNDIGSFQVFSSQGLSEIAHWNLAYPTNPLNLIPNKEEISQIESYFKTQNVTGNLLSADSSQKRHAAEESEYFSLKNSIVPEKSSLASEMSHIEDDLGQFCDLIQISFSLKNSTIEYFKKKMAILGKRAGTKFYVIKSENKIIGGCSMFLSESGSTFMFNVATHPDAQKTGVAKDIIAYAAQRNKRPIYTYSHNPVMRDVILPKLGFTSIGIIWCTPLLILSKR